VYLLNRLKKKIKINQKKQGSTKMQRLIKSKRHIKMENAKFIFKKSSKTEKLLAKLMKISKSKHSQ
jgi:hypothetical protein